MYRRGTPFALLAVLLLAAPAAASAAPRLTLRATPQYGKAGQARTLSGVVTGGAGAPVQVLADEYPFEGSGVLTVLTADARGRVSVKVNPPLNTRYKLVLANDPTVASRPLTVTAFPKGKLETSFVSDRAVHTWTMRTPATYATAAGPQPIRLASKTAWFYGREGKTRRYRRVGSAPLQIVNATTVLARASLPITGFSGKANGFLVCSRTMPVEGMGRLQPDCGRREIVSEPG